MSILNNLLNNGLSQNDGGMGNRISCAIGRWLATRGKNVAIGKTSKVSPASLIHPRGDSIIIGEGCTITSGAQIQGNVKIGNNSSVQSNTIIVGYDKGKVTIGDGVRIAAQGMIIAGNHKFSDPDKPIHGQGIDAKPISIEDGVWIAGSVNIVAGVTIGKGSVIGAGSVVTKDIPPMSIAVGVPAKVVGSRKNKA